MEAISRAVKQFYGAPDAIVIDTALFRLFYRSMSPIFFFCGLIITVEQLVGKPMVCNISGGKDDYQNFFNLYCWIQSTFSFPYQWNVDASSGSSPPMESRLLPHPGLVASSAMTSDADLTMKRYKYYQWVSLFLIFQAFIFYLPGALWKYVEQGKVALVVNELKDQLYISQSDQEKNLDRVLNFWRKYNGHHSGYLIKYVVCEMLNVVNVFVQLYLMDLFLGHEFRTYGLDVLSLTQIEEQKRPDPMAVIFPKMTKCSFHKFGATGSIETADGMCVLPLNAFNEKFFVLAWFALLIMVVMATIQLTLWFALLIGPSIRHRSIKFKCLASMDMGQVEWVLDRPESSLTTLQKLGDWFLLDLIMSNLDEVTRHQLVCRLYKLYSSSDRIESVL